MAADSVQRLLLFCAPESLFLRCSRDGSLAPTATVCLCLRAASDPASSSTWGAQRCYALLLLMVLPPSLS